MMEIKQENQAEEYTQPPFEPPRFVEMESGSELLVDCDALDEETIKLGEIVHVVKPGNRKTHYRILNIEASESDDKATAYVKEAPPIYGSAFLLLTLLVLAWFGLDKLFDFIF